MYSANVTRAPYRMRNLSASPVSHGASFLLTSRARCSWVRGHGPLSGAWIKELRGERTQEAFAEDLGHGINKGMISKWERGEDEPSAPKALILLKSAGLLRNGTDASRTPGVASPPMTPLQAAILEEVKALPDDRQLKLLKDLVVEVTKLSQEGAAHTRG